MSEETTTPAAETEPSEQETPKPKPTETVEFWKQKAREQEARAKANAEAATKLSEFENANKTETQKLSERAESAEKRATDAEGRLTRLEVATSTRFRIRSGRSTAARIAIVPPSEKPAMSAHSRSSASINATRSAPSWRSVQSGVPSEVSPWPRRSYNTTRCRSMRSGTVRRQARWSSARP